MCIRDSSKPARIKIVVSARFPPSGPRDPHPPPLVAWNLDHSPPASNEAGTTGIDNDFAARGVRNIGAWILGRNMFGPIRGPWPDGSWKGWWGDNPPYHTPVFVLTHQARDSITMEGGTTFHFITDGIHSALDRAKEAANVLDVRIGGGVATIQQYLRAGLIDGLHIAIAPILLGSGEKLFSGIDLVSLGYQCVEHVATNKATHVVLGRI